VASGNALSSKPDDGGKVAFLRPGDRRQTSDLLEQASKLWSSLSSLRGSTVRTGFPRIDKLLRPRSRTVTVVAARPKMFKTTLAWNIATNLAFSGRKVLWLGAEMLPEEQVAWAISRMSRIPVESILRYGMHELSLPPQQEALLKDHEKNITSLPMVVWPHTGLTLTELVAAATAAPYDAIFVDYVQIVGTGHSKPIDRVTAVSRSIQKLSRDLSAWWFVLSQMSREIERSDKPRLPTSADLKESGQLEQDADAICFLHRIGHEANKVDFLIHRNRNGPPDVSVPMLANPDYREMLEDPGPDAPPVAEPPAQEEQPTFWEQKERYP